MTPWTVAQPGSSVHGISQARILEWVAISFSGGYSWPRNWTAFSCTGRRVLYPWATREASTSNTSTEAAAGLAGENKAAGTDKEDDTWDAGKEWFHWEKCPSCIFSHAGCLWLIPNWQIRKCKGFLQPGSLACRNLRALCLEQLFIIKKIKMMYCVLYSITRDHEDRNTWNTALPHPTYQ